ncbi:hypothetical protein [Terriglobus sp. TAA 43]|uniref:hypothetical protein n=1 Tax=Terriglobus sp. TAA 43 TaxID=278961 RepID=UPI0012EDD64F|nr:hypothetical protein [Terriglobus sp. TAA 43]
MKMACSESSVSNPMTQASQQGMQWFTDYTKMNLQMAQTASQMLTPVMSAWMSWYQSLLPSQLSDLTKSTSDTLMSMAKSAMCDIPSTVCPPKCACDIEWSAYPGETRKTTVKIRNTSKDTIEYTFVGKPFTHCDKTLDLIPEINTQSVTAAPGETVSVTIGVTVSEQFQSGVAYQSEVLVRGKYERCIKIKLSVACGCDDACSFDQGDIPYHVRPDNWYKHFQCSEPCFEAIQPGRTTTGVNGTDVAGVKS